jgi:hypothetical protein
MVGGMGDMKTIRCRCGHPIDARKKKTGGGGHGTVQKGWARTTRKTRHLKLSRRGAPKVGVCLQGDVNLEVTSVFIVNQNKNRPAEIVGILVKDVTNE